MKIISEKSISGKMWVLDGDAVGGGDIVGSILERRGISDDEAKRIFLNPSLMGQMPDPNVLKGMAEAVQIVADFIKTKKKIAIFGDYDVDGITSAAILIKFLKELDADVIWHLPDREAEGYGLNAASVNDFAKEGAGLLITVDCGTGAAAEVAAAKKLGMKVVVTDHHDAVENLPDADAFGCGFAQSRSTLSGRDSRFSMTRSTVVSPFSRAATASEMGMSTPVFAASSRTAGALS